MERGRYYRVKEEPPHESGITIETDSGRCSSAAPGKEKMMNPEEIGRNIRRYRIKRGLTQEQLAELADLSAGYVRQVELGLKTLSLPTLFRIAEALDTSPQSLLVCAETDSTTRVDALLTECTPWERDVIADIVEAAAESLKRHCAA